MRHISKGAIVGLVVAILVVGLVRFSLTVSGAPPMTSHFIPRNAVHRVENVTHDEPLRVVFFMDSPELVEEFRAIHERVTSDPGRPITPQERAAISERIGGSRVLQK